MKRSLKNRYSYKLVAPLYDWFMKHCEYDVPQKLALAIAEEYGDREAKETYRYFLPKIERDVTIVDAAIGTGLLSKELKKYFNNASVKGYDISGAMLKRCKINNIADELHRCDLDGLAWPIDDGTIDVVACSGALELFEDLSHFLAEASRTLKKGGTLGLTHAISGYTTSVANQYPMSHIQDVSEEHGLKVKRQFQGTFHNKDNLTVQYGFLIAERL